MNVYDSIIKGSKRWPKRAREELNSAVLEYLYDGTEPNLEEMNQYSAGAFEMLQPVLENQRKQRVRAQKPRPSRKASKAKPNASQTLAETQPNDSQTLAIKTIPYSYSSLPSEDELGVDTSSEYNLLVSSDFVPPTLDEVRAFCAANMMRHVDPEVFHSWHEARGWVVNGSPIVNWQSALASWEVRDRNKAASEKQTDYSKYDASNWERG